jgi:hypothetical protein
MEKPGRLEDNCSSCTEEKKLALLLELPILCRHYAYFDYLLLD